MKNLLTVFWATALAMGFIAACGDDDDADLGDDLIEMVSVELVDSTSAVAGHELLVQANLSSTAEIRDVAVTFYMVDEAGVEPSFVLGTEYLDLGVGDRAVPMWVTIPQEATAAGTWLLHAQANAPSSVAEEGPSNNANAIAMAVEIDTSGRPDIVLQDVLCDRCDGQRIPLRDSVPAIVVDVQLLVLGENPVADVEVTVTLDIPDDGQIAAANGIVALEIWDSATETFTTTLSVPELTPGQARPVHLSLRLPEPLRTGLNTHVNRHDWEAVLEIAVNASGAIAESEDRYVHLGRDDNRLGMSVTLEPRVVETYSGTDSVVFNESFKGNTRTMHWPLYVGYLLRPAQEFLIRVSPEADVRGHAGKFSGAHMEASGNVRHEVFPGWFKEPKTPAIEFDFVFDADKDDLSASIYNLDLKVNGDPVDTLWVEDFSNCALEEISIPIILTDSSEADGTGICSKEVTPIGCEIDLGMFQLILDGGLRASMDLGLAACESAASTATDAELLATITRRNTASFFVLLLTRSDELPFFGDALLLGPEQEIDILDETETTTATAKAGLPGSAEFPNGGGELTFGSTIQTGYLGSSLSYVVGLVSSKGLCFEAGLSVSGHSIFSAEVGDCEKQVDLERNLLLTLPPLIMSDAVVTPPTTYRFDFD